MKYSAVCVLLKILVPGKAVPTRGRTPKYLGPPKRSRAMIASAAVAALSAGSRISVGSKPSAEGGSDGKTEPMPKTEPSAPVVDETYEMEQAHLDDPTIHPL